MLIKFLKVCRKFIRQLKLIALAFETENFVKILNNIYYLGHGCLSDKQQKATAGIIHGSVDSNQLRPSSSLSLCKSPSFSL